MCLDEQVSFRDDVLPQLLHGIVVLGAILLNQVDLTEAASANDFDELKVLETDLLCRGEQVFAVVGIDVGLHHLRHGHIFVYCRGHDLLIVCTSDTFGWWNYKRR